MKQKITKIYRNTKDKNGNPLITKNGKPYERVAIQTEQYGDKYISGFGNSTNKNWKVGDIVDIEITQNGQYLNFKTLRKEDIMFKNLDERIKKLEEVVFKQEPVSVDNSGSTYNPDVKRENEQIISEPGEINVDEIPF